MILPSLPSEMFTTAMALTPRRFLQRITSTPFSLLLLAAALWAPAATAEPAIPNLLGRWSVSGKGAVLCKVEASRCKTHHHGDFSDLSATVEITRQQGRVVHGIYRSRYASEKFVGTIGYDNRSFFLVDEDGFADGRLQGRDQIQMVYRHSSDLDSVIDLSTWTRQ